MKRDGFQKLRDSKELTKGEKDYIFDFQYHLAGSFHKCLWEAIARADESNLHKLSLGFPDEVQGYLAWTRGDLYDRASRIAGGDVGFVEPEKENSNA
jgi:hypothetical protein